MRPNHDQSDVAARLAALNKLPPGGHTFTLHWRDRAGQRRVQSYQTSAELLAALGRLRQRKSSRIRVTRPSSRAA
jgi:hypothetical protein